VSTGIPFYDHMLEQVGKHGGFDLRIDATGDLHIDTHHTIVDVAITFGEALREALGRQGRRAPVRERHVPARRVARGGGARPVGPPVRRVGGRDARVPPARQPAFDPSLTEHAIASFATAAGITLHMYVDPRSQRPPHHRGVLFKGLGRCAARRGRIEGTSLPSTKGVL
jgi:imidazoleglycerol-phosphate dehydratase